ncbi:hypothetical protein [Gordonia sp. ABSL49_1]|uniref:glycine-rich domain-containing protein n=1 Tax=Gordonia sp. ABSL49_1 TaxID=2920941 RepID=UPI001F1018DE|nr:hypothetical protein [Gordonia sp. ABSL49_1]MCH5645180.1 hypothetical protein [Gordonia sp. ABSL49_1]
MTLPIGSYDPDNLPVGVYKPEDLGTVLQDHTAETARVSMASRFPAFMSGESSGAASDVDGPLGWLVSAVAQAQSAVAQADPADIKGPDDLLDLAHDVISDLPVVGKFVELWDAMNGDYDGDDPVLQFISLLFAPLRRFIEIITGAGGGLGAAVEDVTGFFDNWKAWSQGESIGADPAGFFTGIGHVAQSISNAIFNGWFGSGATGDPAEVQTTIEAVKDAVLNGYTVTTITSTTAGWSVPSGLTELSVSIIGGGENGAARSGYNGGNGGRGGGHTVLQLDPTAHSTLDITVGTAGGHTIVRAGNVSPHTGAVLAEVGAGMSGGTPSAGGMAMAPVSSGPSGGGGGGAASNNLAPDPGSGGGSGQPGESSDDGGGGAAGTPYETALTAPAAGNAAGNARSAASFPKAGGSGGGGGDGGGFYITGGTGDSGKAGGYPGGGGGGGGGGGAGGAGGAGASGVCWLFYK